MNSKISQLRFAVWASSARWYIFQSFIHNQYSTHACAASGVARAVRAHRASPGTL